MLLFGERQGDECSLDKETEITTASFCRRWWWGLKFVSRGGEPFEGNIDALLSNPPTCALFLTCTSNYCTAERIMEHKNTVQPTRIAAHIPTDWEAIINYLTVNLVLPFSRSKLAH